VKVSRDGSFVRVDLPGPGKWVLAMCPNTAMHLTHLASKVETGSHVIDGDLRICFQAVDETYVRVTFPPWPGELYWTPCEVACFCRELRHASQAQRDVCIPSSGAEVQVGQ